MKEVRQSYNEDFKRQTVQFIQGQTKSIPELSVELGVPVGTLRQWMRKYRQWKHEPAAVGETVQQQAKLLKQQEAEIQDLKEELAILKKAVHIFSKERN
ncbi:transposase [Paenibacillus sp. HW567]|uniref:transposase n=1 Tax=Paenibacillus sp. HW567 TaxID=1034769 RepID=UPI0003796626|nr:transposase [Paenibacillus sp. HW567]